MSKAELTQILSLSHSDRDRELIKCTAFLASGISNKSARNHFGFQNLLKINSGIRQFIESLSEVQDEAFMRTLGVVESDSSDLISEYDMPPDHCHVNTPLQSCCLIELLQRRFFELLKESESIGLSLSTE